MADVAFDHNMDFSIDTRGPFDNNDDIEIDLDIDHEPVEDRDGDVMVDDVSATASEHAEGVQDYQNDADMLDEDYTEDQQIDAGISYQHGTGYQYVDEDTYRTENTYEAEMEDEYEEDIDAPIPGAGTLELQGSVTEEAHYQSTEPSFFEPPRTKSKSPEDKAASGPTLRAESVASQTLPREIKEAEDDENRAQPKDEVTEEAPEQCYRDENAEKEVEQCSGEIEPSQPQPKESLLSIESKEDFEGDGRAEDYGSPAEEGIDHGALQATNNGVNLHNVKVLYQDNEISLFPPMEDDPTETYFIEDPALAHEPIGQFFHACRLVLDEHITEQEELVVDIDSLNLHLSENASQNSSITLFQLTKVYRDLSLNDGVNEPEPLYLTLSTRESFEASYHYLLQFVEDGKGLSSIHSWEEYEEEEAESDTLVPKQGESDVLNVVEQDYAEEGPVEVSTVETLESNENVEGTPQASLAEEPREEITVSAGALPHPADVDRASGQDEKFFSKSPEQSGYTEEASVTEGGHSPRDIEQPGENENVDKTSEPGRPESQGYGTSEEGYSEASKETQDTGDVDGQRSFAEDTETVEEADSKGEYPLPDDANNPLQWQQEEERAKSPDFQTQLQVAAPEEASNVSLTEEASGHEVQHPYPSLDAEDVEKNHPIEIAVGGEEPTQEVGDVMNPPEEYFDEPDFDISIGNDEELNPSYSHEHDQPAEGSKLETEEQPGTPVSSRHGLFDIDEDLFKSPVTKPAPAPPMDDSRSEFMLDDNTREPVQADVETTNGTVHPDEPELESGEVSAEEDEYFATENGKPLSERNSTPAKRLRPDDEADASEGPVPQLKRHRSE